MINFSRFKMGVWVLHTKPKNIWLYCSSGFYAIAPSVSFTIGSMTSVSHLKVCFVIVQLPGKGQGEKRRFPEL